MYTYERKNTSENKQDSILQENYKIMWSSKTIACIIYLDIYYLIYCILHNFNLFVYTENQMWKFSLFNKNMILFWFNEKTFNKILDSH